MTPRIVHADVFSGLSEIADATVDCVVTSPPYWQLRDYGYEGQIGLEPTIGEFVSKLGSVFAELWRALKPTGSVWVNLGDTYSTKPPGPQGQGTLRDWKNGGCRVPLDFSALRRADVTVRQKSLCGVPWRVALALQDAGWIIRQDIIWHKPNPMPESVRDRCTRAHEYVFHLVKGGDYFWAADAMKEPVSGGAHPRRGKVNWAAKGEVHDSKVFAKGGRRTPRYNPSFSTAVTDLVEVRNRRSVWTVAPEPTKERHWAAFPTKLVRPMIAAACPPGGLVLDPFAGTGTVGIVARELGCPSILIDGNAEYCDIMRRRFAGEGA